MLVFGSVHVEHFMSLDPLLLAAHGCILRAACALVATPTNAMAADAR